MDDHQRREDAGTFACQVLGLDGVSESAPPPGSPLARLVEVEQRCRVEGLSDEQTVDALVRAIREGS